MNRAKLDSQSHTMFLNSEYEALQYGLRHSERCCFAT